MEKHLKNTIVIDIDDTICFPNHGAKCSNEKYAEALPNLEVIIKVRELYAEGYKIIFHTARRMVTHNGDLDAILADVGQITHHWLIRHDVPYDEIIFGKPYGIWCVDDKAMSIERFLNF